MDTSRGSPGQNSEPKKSDRFLGVYREYGAYLTLGLQLAAAVVVFLVAGIWADARAGTSPLFTLLGLLLGSVGGFIKFFRTVSQLEKKNPPPSHGGAA